MKHYWSWWLLAIGATFAYREFPALATGRYQDTFSWYVWTHLKVVTHQPIRDWTAEHFLVAVMFLGFFGWLGAHLFFRILR